MGGHYCTIPMNINEKLDSDNFSVIIKIIDTIQLLGVTMNKVWVVALNDNTAYIVWLA